MAKKKAVYRWIMHNDGDAGTWKLTKNQEDFLSYLADNGFPPEITEAYAKLGGTPWLDFRHTVFGQVVNGMDVVDAIAGVQVGANDKPVNDVVINGIDIIIKD